MTLLRAALPLAIGLSLTTGAIYAEIPEDTPLYQVEVIIFEQATRDADVETWPEGTISELASSTVAAGRVALDGESSVFESLDKSAKQLAPHAYSLSRKGGHKVLWHEAWVQPIASQALTPALDLSGNATPPVTDANAEATSTATQLFRSNTIQGTIQLYKSRFLHLSADLHLLRETGRHRFDRQPVYESANTISSEDGFSSAPPTRLRSSPEYRQFRLTESRRVNVDELQYFDHSRLGMLVQISKLEDIAPEADAQTDVLE